jgi:hypothetical protein
MKSKERHQQYKIIELERVKDDLDNRLEDLIIINKEKINDLNTDKLKLISDLKSEQNKLKEFKDETITLRTNLLEKEKYENKNQILEKQLIELKSEKIETDTNSNKLQKSNKLLQNNLEKTKIAKKKEYERTLKVEGENLKQKDIIEELEKVNYK